MTGVRTFAVVPQFPLRGKEHFRGTWLISNYEYNTFSSQEIVYRNYVPLGEVERGNICAHVQIHTSRDPRLVTTCFLD